MKTRICLCVLAALLMIPVAVTAQTKKTKKEVAIQLYSVRDILNRVDNKDGKCDPAYTAIGSYYNKSDSWFKEEARKRIQNGLILTDLPW